MTDAWSCFFAANQQPNKAGTSRSRSRPAESDPLGVITWYLESGSTINCAIKTPLAEFELHHYDFSPLRQAVERARVSAAVKFSLVSLSIVRCAQRCAPFVGATGAASHEAKAAFEADCELRLTIIRHIVKEMIRLQRFKALMIYRLNAELDPAMDMIYQHAIIADLNKLQPQIRPPFTDAKHKSLQIVIQPTS